MLLPAAFQENSSLFNGILWVYTSEGRWRDMPEKYGKFQTGRGRARRLRSEGLWEAFVAKAKQFGYFLPEDMDDNEHRDYDGMTLRDEGGAGQQGWPGAQVRETLQGLARRSLLLRILKPHPEIEEVEGWLEKYIEGYWKTSARNSQGLLETSMEEEAFSVFLDPSTNQINVVEPHQVTEPTMVVYIHYRTAYMIAGRSETYSILPIGR